MKSEHEPRPTPNNLELLFASSDIVHPAHAQELRTELTKKNTLYYEDSNMIVSKYEEQAEEGSRLHYNVFDKKNGLPNYRVTYKKTGNKKRISEIATWEYKQDPENININVTIKSLYKGNDALYPENTNAARITLYKLHSKTFRFSVETSYMIEPTQMFKPEDEKKIANQIYFINNKVKNSEK